MLLKEDNILSPVWVLGYTYENNAMYTNELVAAKSFKLVHFVRLVLLYFITLQHEAIMYSPSKDF